MYGQKDIVQLYYLQKPFVWTLVENMAGIIIIALRMVTVLEIARIVFVFILAVLL